MESGGNYGSATSFILNIEYPIYYNVAEVSYRQDPVHLSRLLEVDILY
jgi:hypothetical protein